MACAFACFRVCANVRRLYIPVILLAFSLVVNAQFDFLQLIRNRTTRLKINKNFFNLKNFF